MEGLPKAKKMLCLMIVNDTYDKSRSKRMPSDRKDAIGPARRLKSTLENNCVCHVVLQRNLKVEEMQAAVANLVNGTTANLADFDTVWLVLSSHGDWELFPNSANPTHQADVIWGIDDTVPIHLLTKQLLKTGKPCAIVSQACRGDQLAAVGEVTVDEHGDAASYNETKPKYRASDRERAENTWPELDSYANNQIMLFSSLPGNISFRRPLFPALIEVLQEVDLSTTDVKTLFEKTCQKEQCINRAASKTGIVIQKLCSVDSLHARKWPYLTPNRKMALSPNLLPQLKSFMLALYSFLYPGIGCNK
ncbi:hypothetical protein CAPTEDRAFT_220303 [Capitella teleta]|uniref:Caspase family p20 domain-containing protein n=1 Tax=Capitella teleta TaxID=283909 RepID=R7V0F1_CAPTE|nr:hypothetical protein CAPTEDRAFT_220303 [Capitella teleta]|eukprot:ELU11992.1 hypothetical protein CAPTEDRAFT_220303 [Capitella teleta]